MSQQKIEAFLSGADPTRTGNVADLSMLLEAVRQYLKMDVAFTSRFTETDRQIELVRKDKDAESWCNLQFGDTDPLDQSYCFKIAEGQLSNIIADTSADPTTNEMPVTRALDIGSYIGVPIPLKDGEIYGTLCCYDKGPNESLDERDLELLQIIASYIGQVLGRTYSSKKKQDIIRKQVRAVIDNGKLDVVFQPIYGRSSQNYEYYEVLARFNTEPYRPPNEWLSDADLVDLGLEVESAIVHKVAERLTQANEVGLGLKVAVNVSPRMMESGLLPELLNNVDSNQLRLELTEHVRITNYERFREFLRPLTDKGFKICIDDVGAGFASLKHILEIEPDVIKLDLSLASNIHNDTKRQALVTGLLAFANSFDCEVVAEGVETIEEYRALEALGVRFFQGWYFSRPMGFEQLSSASPHKMPDSIN